MNNLFKVPDHNYEEYRYDVYGYDVDGYDVDGFDREGNQSLDSFCESIKCSECNEKLSDWWKEIRQDLCADCVKKQNSPKFP